MAKTQNQIQHQESKSKPNPNQLPVKSISKNHSIYTSSEQDDLPIFMNDQSQESSNLQHNKQEGQIQPGKRFEENHAQSASDMKNLKKKIIDKQLKLKTHKFTSNKHRLNSSRPSSTKKQFIATQSSKLAKQGSQFLASNLHPQKKQLKRLKEQKEIKQMRQVKQSRSSKQFRQFRLAKQIKKQELLLITKTFNLYCCQFINFNQFVLALKLIGVNIQSEKKLTQLSDLYIQFTKNTAPGLDLQIFTEITVGLLKEEKTKPNSDRYHLEKGYYYMIQQANNIKLPLFPDNQQKESSRKTFYHEFRRYIDSLGDKEKYLTKNSLVSLVKYLGIEKQFLPSTIDSIMMFGDREGKGYLTFEDFLFCIQELHILDF